MFFAGRASYFSLSTPGRETCIDGRILVWIYGGVARSQFGWIGSYCFGEEVFIIRVVSGRCKDWILW